jgi:hypothetical protein
VSPKEQPPILSTNEFHIKIRDLPDVEPALFPRSEEGQGVEGFSWAGGGEVGDLLDGEGVFGPVFGFGGEGFASDADADGDPGLAGFVGELGAEPESRWALGIGLAGFGEAVEASPVEGGHDPARHSHKPTAHLT